MIPLEVAQAKVIGACVPLAPRRVLLDDALGCVTAERVMADDAVPPFANTAMDGYAVRAADTAGAPVVLEVLSTAAAGSDPGVMVGEGQAVRIMTGAPMPEGADAVVMVEATEPAGDSGSAVRILEAAAQGDYVRPAGEDLPAGSEVFPSKTVLGPGHIGVLASIGVTEVCVFPRVRVGVLSYGDELVEGTRKLKVGEIRDSNRHALLALARESGFEPVDLGIAPDDEARIAAAVEKGVGECDAVLTSGGVSVGDFDYVKVVLDRLSAGEMSWMQVAIKPAKPLAFGVVEGTPVFGLPGNPVSSMVSFELFARPALRRMMGFEELHRPRIRAIADEPLRRSPDGKLHLQRVVVAPGTDGLHHVRPSGGQGSHMLRAMALANALALVPDGKGVEAGEPVEVLLLG